MTRLTESGDRASAGPAGGAPLIRNRDERRAALLRRREDQFSSSCRAAASALACGEPERARVLAVQAGMLKPDDLVVRDLLDAVARSMGRDRASSLHGPASWYRGTAFAGTPRRTTAAMCSAFSLLLHGAAGVFVVGLVVPAVPLTLEAPPAIRPFQSITFVMPPPAGADRPQSPPAQSPPEADLPPPEEAQSPALPEPIPEPGPPVAADLLATSVLDVAATPALPDAVRPSLQPLIPQEPQVLSAAAVAPFLGGTATPALPNGARGSLQSLLPREPQVLSAAAVGPSSGGQYGLPLQNGLRLAALLSPPQGYWDLDEIDREPILEHYVRPHYPDEAVEREVEGVVTVHLSISYTGHVARARIARGVAELNEAALDAARQFVFKPAIKRGFAVPVVMTMDIRFNLNSLR